MEGHGSAPTAQDQKSRITPRATPALTPCATGGIEARWPCPRGSWGSRPATRCVPAAGHLMVASKKWEGPQGAAAQRNPRPRKSSFTHPWATGCPGVTPRGAGHGPCHHRHHSSPPGSERDSPALGVARRGISAPAALGRVPVAQGHRQARCCGRPGAPRPRVGETTQPLSRRGRPRARQAPGTAAPARQSGRRPRSPGGDFDPAAGRACRHLLPAGYAAAAAAPAPSRTPTEEPLLAPAPLARSVPPAGAPAAALPPPRAVTGAAEQTFRAEPLPVPPPPRGATPLPERGQQLSSAATHPRARRREAAALPHGAARLLPVPRQLLPQHCAGGPTTFCASRHRRPSSPFSSPSSPPPAARPCGGPSLGPGAPFVGRASAAGAGGPPRPRPLLGARGGKGPGRRGGEEKGKQEKGGAERVPAAGGCRCGPAPPSAPPGLVLVVLVVECCPAPLLPWGLPARTCALSALLLLPSLPT